MIAMNYSALRGNMRAAFDACSDDYETIIVTRRNKKNIVCMSEEMYNNLMENAYVRSSKANYDHILKSIAQLQKGEVHKKALSDE